MRTRPLSSFVALLALLVSSCGPSDRREYELKGQILAVSPDHTQATIKHEDIKGFMSAMTMAYKARDPKQFESLVPGDLIQATLIVVKDDMYLEDVKKVGNTPIGRAPETNPASARFELIREGQPIPDARLTDQNGTRRDFSSFVGEPLVVTFIYTKCPMPTYCPLMDRNFAAMQDKIKASPDLKAHLVSVSFDPLADTPAVLNAHARKVGADPKVWTFLTGDRDEIDRFAARFGIQVMREQDDALTITHNLRTALIDRDGRLAKVYSGNEWTPDEALADLKTIAGTD